MKKTVLTFGLISGAVSSLMMLLTVPFLDRIGFDRAEILGYTTIIASFLLVFFGIRSYRDNLSAGSLTFGRGVLVGLLITLVSSACYVATWQVIYYNDLAPGFLDKYAAHKAAQMRASGASQEEMDKAARDMQSFKEMYDKPLMNVALTFLEPFPIGLAVTLISATVLRRKSGTTLSAAPR